MNTSSYRALLLSIIAFIGTTTDLHGTPLNAPQVRQQKNHKSSPPLADTTKVEPIQIEEKPSTPNVLVESILFRNNSQPETDELTWFANTPGNPSAITTQTNPAPLMTRYQPSSELQEMAQKISWSKYYTLIDSQAWLQPIAQNASQNPIKLQLSWKDYAIEGTISVYKSRSLHVMSDVLIRRKPSDADAKNSDTHSIVATTNPTESTSQSDQLKASASNSSSDSQELNYATVTARLTDTRRVRHNQWTFFDHPNFGMLVKVSKFED